MAQEFGISQMHVSRLITGACRRIREEIENTPEEEGEEGTVAA
ncbi:hypothetical protein ACWGJ2_40015 [Streptomyces sp. NPDC054796]